MNDRLRIGDADREQASAELAEHYVQGRLTTEEHSERLDRIWAARTRAELAPVFADLPGPARPVASTLMLPRPARGRSHGRPAPLVVVLAILLAVTVVTHLPVILFGLLAWCFVTGRWHGPARR